MRLRSDLARLVSGLTADTSKIAFDQPGWLYDRVHAALERLGILPASLRGRIAVVGGALLAKNLLDVPQNLATDLADDGLVETLKRVIEHADSAPSPTAAVPLGDRINAGLERLAEFIVPGLER